MVRFQNGAGNILLPQPSLPLKDFRKLWMMCILTGHCPCKDIYKGDHTHHSLWLHLETPDLNWKNQILFLRTSEYRYWVNESEDAKCSNWKVKGRPDERQQIKVNYKIIYGGAELPQVNPEAQENRVRNAQRDMKGSCWLYSSLFSIFQVYFILHYPIVFYSSSVFEMASFIPSINPLYWCCFECVFVTWNHTILCLLAAAVSDAGSLSLAEWRDLINVTWEHGVVSMVILTVDSQVLFIVLSLRVKVLLKDMK